MLRRSGCRDEKIVFILDESNMLDSSFLERMNTLLANGEVREGWKDGRRERGLKERGEGGREWKGGLRFYYVHRILIG